MRHALPEFPDLCSQFLHVGAELRSLLLHVPAGDTGLDQDETSQGNEDGGNEDQELFVGHAVSSLSLARVADQEDIHQIRRGQLLTRSLGRSQRSHPRTNLTARTSPSAPHPDAIARSRSGAHGPQNTPHPFEEIPIPATRHGRSLNDVQRPNPHHPSSGLAKPT